MFSYLFRTQKQKEMAAAKIAITEVARRESKTVDEVRTEMMEMMLEGWNNPDPAAREMWAQIPCEGDMPTPEELIIWVAKRCKSEA